MAEQEEPEKDPVFEELITTISDHFAVAHTFAESTLQLSTEEVYERLQKIYPSRTYNKGDVFRALRDLEFVYDDPTRTMDYKWLFIAR